MQNFPWPVSSTPCDELQRMAWISKSANYVDDLKLLERSKHLKLIEIGFNFPFRYSEQIGPLSKSILQLELDGWFGITTTSCKL
jgi:hypothetical protein